MRTMKKLMVLVLSVMMVLGTSVVSAFAADSIKITLKSPDPGTETGESLTAYKVLDVTKKDGVNAHNDNSAALGFSYYIAKNSAWIQAVRAVTQFDLTETADNTGYNVKLDDGITPSESVAKEIAATLLANKPPAASGITVASGETVDAEAGYYLIESPLGSNLILATTNIEITEKNNYPTVDKAVAAKDEVAEIGSIVTFTLTVDVPTTATQKITLTDTMSEGLTFVAIDSVKQGNTDVDHDDTDADQSGARAAQPVLRRNMKNAQQAVQHSAVRVIDDSPDRSRRDCGGNHRNKHHAAQEAAGSHFRHSARQKSGEQKGQNRLERHRHQHINQHYNR